MAVQVYSYSINVPKGGTAAAPQRFNIPTRVGTIDGVEIFVPSGGNGQLFFALGANGTITIPANAGQYLTLSGDTIKWPLEHQIDSGAWQLFAYNTGNAAHFMQIRFLLSLPNLALVPAQSIIETVELSGDLGGGIGGGGGPGTGGVPFSFTLPASLPPVSVQQGGTASSTLSLSVTGEAPAPFDVEISHLPPGVTATAVQQGATALYVLQVVASATAVVKGYTATVTVSCAGITQVASLPLTVTVPGSGGGQPPAKPTLAASPTTVQQGSTLAVSGTGFTPYTAVTLYIGTWNTQIAADSSGNLAVTFVVPSQVLPGSYTLIAIGTVNGVAQTQVNGPSLTILAAQQGVPVFPLDGRTYHVPLGQLFGVSIQAHRAVACDVSIDYSIDAGIFQTDNGGNATWYSSSFVFNTPTQAAHVITACVIPLNKGNPCYTVTIASP